MPDISVNWAIPVPDDFHARFDAKWRHYRYYIYNNSHQMMLFAPYTWWVTRNLNVEAMQLAAPSLLGEHDFSAFRGRDCQSLSSKRNLYRLEIRRHLIPELIIIDICANSFVQHMVRNLVGALVMIGLNQRPIDWLPEVLYSADRQHPKFTAPAIGLTLLQVGYPQKYAIPVPQYGFFGEPV